MVESLLFNAAGFINPFVSSNMALDANAIGQLRISAASGSGTTLAITQNVADDTGAINIVVKYGDTSNAPETTIKALMMSPAATFYVSYAAAAYFAYNTYDSETWDIAAGTDPNIASAGFKDEFMNTVLETAGASGYPFYYATYENLINFSFASDEGLPNNELTPGQTSELYLTVTNADSGERYWL